MARVLISFLGLGKAHTPMNELGYDEAIYRFSDGRQIQTPLSQEAIVKYIGAQNLDQVITLMTPKSKARHYHTLYQRFIDLGLNDEQMIWDDTSITSDQSHEDQWSWFNALVSHIHRGDEVIFDFTHGFRSVPIIFSSAINYLQRVKHINVLHAFYGYLTDFNSIPKGGQIIDMVAFYQLNEWVDGVSALVRDANANVLADLAERTNQEESDFAGFKSLGNPELVTALRELTACIKEINMNLVPQKANYALHVLKSQKENCVGPDLQLLEMAIDTFSELGSALEHGRYSQDYFKVQLALLDALLEHQLEMQALTVMRELIGSIGMLGAPEKHLKHKMTSSKGRDARRRFGEVFIAMCQYPEDQWRFPGDLVQRDHEYLKQFWHNLKNLGLLHHFEFVEDMVKLRNAFNHAWTGSGQQGPNADHSTHYRDQLRVLIEVLITHQLIPN